MLIVTGCFGPGILLALLGVIFVIPTDEDLSDRAIVLAVLLVVLFVIDRLGAFRAVGSNLARALARRMLDDGTFETWIVVGDHAVGELIVPSEETRAAATIATSAAADLRVLAVDHGEPGQTTFPDDGRAADAAPGDRVVVFGPRRDLDSLPCDLMYCAESESPPPIAEWPARGSPDRLRSGCLSPTRRTSSVG